MKLFGNFYRYAAACVLMLVVAGGAHGVAQAANSGFPAAESRVANLPAAPAPESASYRQTQWRLAQGWNTWDVHSVTTHVLLPDGLAIHIGMKYNTTEGGDSFLADALIGRRDRDAEEVFPGPHSWDGSYTALRVAWRGHSWQIQSAHDGKDLVILARPLPGRPDSALPPTIVFSVNYLWNKAGTAQKDGDAIVARGVSGTTPIYCVGCNTAPSRELVYLPVSGPYFSTDFTRPVGISTGKRHTMEEIEAIVKKQHDAYWRSIQAKGSSAATVDAIETTLGWDTIYEPEGRRVISPVSRVWSLGWGGYVIFDWDTFFAATMASVGDRDLAYADAMETLRESTPQGFVPNYARAGHWKSSDRSEPPVGAITVLGLYQKFHDRWFLEDTYQPLLRWNRWWAAHRDIQGYLTWGSDGENKPINLDDDSRGTWQGAIYESGLDNSPMYDGTVYNKKTHLLEYADVGLMSMYIADCNALATMADILHKASDAKELRDRAARYRAKLETLWSDQAGIFLNKDLHTGKFNLRLSPTNFYPMLARVATPSQAQTMIRKHLLNPNEFWGQWVIPSIARDDPAFHDQDYWRGRIWGPLNYLVYLGLRNYDDQQVRREFARKSFALFLKEWKEKGHVHENYSAITGSGDDVVNSDRFYHWGALLGYIEYMEQGQP